MNNITYLVIDESGAMHLKDSNHFIIAGYLTNNLLRVKSIQAKKEKAINKKFFNGKGELKACNCPPYLISDIIINEIVKCKIIPVGIVICKDKLWKKQWNENSAFSYFTTCLLKFLISKSIITNKQILVFPDSRSQANNFKNDLETHLNLNFIENYIFNVKYKDSKTNEEIRVADFIANLYFSFFNKTKTKKTIKLEEILNKQNLYNTIFAYVDYFPLSNCDTCINYKNYKNYKK